VGGQHGEGQGALVEIVDVVEHERRTRGERCDVGALRSDRHMGEIKLAREPAGYLLQCGTGGHDEGGRWCRATHASPPLGVAV
jgi:hypothetical protein